MKIAEVNFDPRHSREEVAKAVEWLATNKHKFHAAANFVIVGTETVGLGSEVVFEKHIGRVCHRYIKDTMFNARSVIGTECGWARSNKTIEDVAPFFDWFVKESFASRFILTADINHGFVVSADTFAPLMQNIMIVTRHFYEGSKASFAAFNQMVLNGIPGDVAYPIAFNTSVRSGVDTAKFSSYCSHTVTHLFSLAAFQNFVDGELGPNYSDVEAYLYRVNTNYRGGYMLFWPDSEVPSFMNFTYDCNLIPELMKIEEFRNALAKSRKGKQIEAYQAPNPFAPKSTAAPSLAPNEVTCAEAIEVVAPFLGTYLYSSRKEQ